MRFRAKVRELEAIKYDGTNKDAIGELTGRVFAEAGGNDPYLIIKGGFVDIGDWVGVEDGQVRILGDAEIRRDYECVGQPCAFETEMKTIYISGPMSNTPNSNLEAFDKAEKQLVKLGYKVLNPHKICEELNVRFFEMGKIPDYEDYLKEDIIQMLAKCDALLVLPGWRNSKGSKLEIANAIECGLDVVFDISDVQ